MKSNNSKQQYEKTIKQLKTKVSKQQDLIDQQNHIIICLKSQVQRLSNKNARLLGSQNKSLEQKIKKINQNPQDNYQNQKPLNNRIQQPVNHQRQNQRILQRQVRDQDSLQKIPIVDTSFKNSSKHSEEKSQFQKINQSSIHIGQHHLSKISNEIGKFIGSSSFSIPGINNISSITSISKVIDTLGQVKGQKATQLYKQGYNIYQNLKGRNSHQKVLTNEQSCSNQTNFYLRGDDYQQGGRKGLCGTKKDHRRIYLCEQCKAKSKI